MTTENIPEMVGNAIIQLQREVKNCKTLEDYITTAFSFRYKDCFIFPTQKIEEIKQLLEILEKRKPKTVLEIGTSTGGTLFLLCNVAHSGATIISIDLPEGPFGGEFFQDWKIPLYKSFVRDGQRIHFVRSDSHDKSTLNNLKKLLEKNKIDFLLIDGDHTYEGIKKDFEMYSPLVSEGGIIAFHDVKPGPKEKVGEVLKFWKEIKNNFLSTEIVNGDKKIEGYGIGLVFFQSQNKVSPTYLDSIKIINELNERQNNKLKSNQESIEFQLKNNPLGFLLHLYSIRKDLQKLFPEVKKGDYKELLGWAISIHKGEVNEIQLKSDISKFAIWYENYLKNQDELKQIRKLLTEEKSKAEKLESVVEQEKSKAEKLENEMRDFKNQFESVIQSQSWQFILKFRNKLNKHFPSNTKRRAIFDGIILSLIKKGAMAEKAFNVSPEIKEIEIKNRNYLDWKSQTQKILTSEKRKIVKNHKEISVIIPVHNGLRVLIPCIESVIKWSTEPYEIIVVDDFSSDKEIKKYLKQISKIPNVKIIENQENLGFVKSINKGLENSKNDVVLLNSDTLVTEGWLDKIYSCAYSHSKIAAVSPLSNNATICSVPEFAKPNEIPKGYTIDEFAKLIEKISKFRYPISPTCPGFCIFLKRKIIDEIGLFDEDFSPAYGEEDDFCMRAYESGYLPVIDDSTFIFHHGKASYDQKTSVLEEKHMKILLKKHPAYLDIVSGFFSENPLSKTHNEIKTMLSSKKNFKNKNILMVIHQSYNAERPGGTELFVKTTFEALEGYTKYLMYTEGNRLKIDEFSSSRKRTIYNFKKRSSDFIKATPQEEEFFSNVLDELKIDMIHFHHLKFMPLNFFKIAKEKDIKTIINCSDYYFICPTANLLENGKFENFCDACQDLERCDKCLTGLGYRSGLQEDWRNECQKMFEQADFVITPTESVSKMFQKTYRIDSGKLRTIYNGFTPKLDVSISDPVLDSEKFRVGFVGEVMVPHKGKDLILETVMSNNNKKIEWHFFGKNSNPFPYLKMKNSIIGKVVNHVLYKKEELPKMLNDSKINVVIIPSLETFSNVLSEVWTAHTPVIVPNFLALGERVTKTGAGWTYEYPGTPRKILEIIDKISSPENYNEKLSKFKHLKISTNEECSKEYAQVYQKVLDWPLE